ncbi:MAG: hypothetical protein AAGC85_26860 [Bacteroidota bacterium]
MDWILTSSDFEFLNALEYAAIRRQVISVEFQAEAGVWHSTFIRGVENENGGIIVITSKGEKIPLGHISRISPSFKEIDIEAIGCLCH